MTAATRIAGAQLQADVARLHASMWPFLLRASVASHKGRARTALKALRGAQRVLSAFLQKAEAEPPSVKVRWWRCTRCQGLTRRPRILAPGTTCSCGGGLVPGLRSGRKV